MARQGLMDDSGYKGFDTIPVEMCSKCKYCKVISYEDYYDEYKCTLGCTYLDECEFEEEEDEEE